MVAVVRFGSEVWAEAGEVDKGCRARQDQDISRMRGSEEPELQSSVVKYPKQSEVGSKRREA